MNLVQRRITYRLYPTRRQTSEMLNLLRLHQELYNAALEQRIYAYKQRGKALYFYDQCKELTLLRAEMSEHRAVHSSAQQVTLKRLDSAYINFFKRVREGAKKFGFPRFKSLERFPGFGFTCHGKGWKLLAGDGMKNGYLRLTGVGHIKIRGGARNIGTLKKMDILHKQDRWYASVTIECEPKRTAGKKAIGVDWGIETFATIADSEGSTTAIKNPRFLRKKLKKLKVKQKEMSRKKWGSNNRRKARKVVAQIHGTVANQRKEFLHQVTASLVKDSSFIAVEELNIKGMSAGGGSYKKGLNREILSAAPGTFHKMLKCKAEEAGLEFVKINTRKAKPSQSCHVCGRQEKKLLSVRTHACPCGVVCGRDENAAKVILNWALFGNATGREPASCGGETIVFPVKQEILSTVAQAA